MSVSRETSRDLSAYVALITKWSSAINLLSRNDRAIVWERHIADAIQLSEVAPAGVDWIDLGSGGGFPAVPVAIHRKGSDTCLTLVEADTRKAAFLRTVRRELGLEYEVINDRIEHLRTERFEVVTARALSSLHRLLDHHYDLVANNGLGLYPKGRTWHREVEAARRTYEFDFQPITSVAGEGSIILKVENVRRRADAG
ncbi:16S rRNA (guanine(527)-N(7))-methyltransferase RsmG [Jannaschia sp. LMIT008]|uniref:16S rRNA (guanine(527)-N(7))-methyltransferase RsmG n=1 Tax=Jannaschia maritima TaxID=3032585 RepID=UPI00281202F6|nr:16S rRNA (guanine(527)-N(7))-methyltransferase RsmG [Jannaschia sp. LMIT008]